MLYHLPRAALWKQQRAADAVVALDVTRNTYLYLAWDAGLRRTVVFVPGDGCDPIRQRSVSLAPARAFAPHDAALEFVLRCELRRNRDMSDGSRVRLPSAQDSL
jgi:hypothetical protein